MFILDYFRELMNRLIRNGTGNGQAHANGKEYLSSTRERQRIVQGVREFFGQNYELRYNVMKQTEEYRPRQNRKAAFDSLQAPLGNLQAPYFPTEAPYKNLQAPNSSTEAPGWRPMV